MADAGVDIAALLRAVAAGPGGRATVNDVAASVSRPPALVAGELRNAQRAGYLDSAVTLAHEPGADRVYWLTADRGHAVVARLNNDGVGDDLVKIFVVDDSATARRVVRLVLEADGVTVVGEATSGEEALAHVPEAAPDIVVMDWQMPGINGVETTRLLLERHPSLHVVGFSSSGAEEIHQAFLDAGAAAAFHKADVRKLADYVRAGRSGVYHALEWPSARRASATPRRAVGRSTRRRHHNPPGADRRIAAPVLGG
jgi:DNA-binding NarL/FixJ family response regulator